MTLKDFLKQTLTDIKVKLGEKPFLMKNGQLLN